MAQWFKCCVLTAPEVVRSIPDGTFLFIYIYIYIIIVSTPTVLGLASDSPWIVRRQSLDCPKTVLGLRPRTVRESEQSLDCPRTVLGLISDLDF